jgi:hypothetical protein
MGFYSQVYSHRFTRQVQGMASYLRILISAWGQLLRDVLTYSPFWVFIDTISYNSVPWLKDTLDKYYQCISMVSFTCWYVYAST